MYKILLFTLFSLSIYSQNFKPEVRYLSEVPKKNDFIFLEEELKDVQIVMLGEHTHQDGNSFEVKTEIIKYLVEELGFNTIAFESGTFELWNAQKKINNGTPSNLAFQDALYSIWGKRNEFQSFCEYYELNKNKLNLFGFDNQFSGTYSPKEISANLFDYAQENNFKFKFNYEDFELLLEAMHTSSYYDDSDIPFELFKIELNRFINKINKNKDSVSVFYWKTIAKNLIDFGSNLIEGYQTVSSFYVSKSDNLRDKQMADNLLSYIKHNPNSKIICWGASVHFSNGIQTINDSIITEFIPMGSYIKRELKERVYSLTLNSAQDSIYLNDKWEKTPIKENTFEDYLKKLEINHPVFISSNQTELSKTIEHRLFSPITFVKGNLSEHFDGYLYLPIIKNSTAIDINIVNKKSDNVPNQFTLVQNVKNLTKDKEIEEVVVYGRKTPYQIINKTIALLEENYPKQDFNSIMFVNIKGDFDGVNQLDLNINANQYDRGYVNNIYRSSKNIKDVIWVTKKDFIPLNLREFFGLVYNNPIEYASFLKLNKFKKFNLILEEIIKEDGEEIYKIYFSSPRNYSLFTKRVYKSNYHGYIFINKKDNAILKIIENWDVLDFPEHFRNGYNLKNELSKFTNKEYQKEISITEFKKVEGKYVITNFLNTVEGNIYNNLGEKTDFEIQIKANWDNFNFKNPIEIKYKNENHVIE